MHVALPRLRSSLLLLASLLAACGSGGGGGSTQLAVQQYVASVKSFDGALTATAHAGAPPAATSTLQADVEAVQLALASNTYLRGGTSSIAVTGSATRIIIAVDGVDGYWELSGLTPGATQSVLVTFGQSGPDTFGLRIGSGSATAITSYQTLPVTLTSVGTGQVQVNVTWDLDVDVDLHVLDPGGNEIYYGNMTQGDGKLDLDSNASCSLDHVRAENITWPTGKAPTGTYKVLVDYYQACSAGPVNYVVTVNVTGKAPQTFAKTFANGSADGGSACFPASGTTLACGVLITTFTVP
jgi:hypothetical protein